MSLLKDITELLRKPAAPAPRMQPTTGRRAKAPVPVSETATAAELREVLAALRARREHLEESIASESADREEAMENADLDSLVLIGQALDRASIEIELLDRREPALVARLRQLQGAENSARFAEVRDKVIAAAAEAIPVLQAAAAANEVWAKVRHAALLEFPDAYLVLPGLIKIQQKDVAAFEADIARCRNTVRLPQGLPVMHSVQSMIDHAMETGELPDPLAPGAADVERALQKSHVVRTTRSVTLREGRLVKADEEIGVSFDEASQLVRSGKATWKD